MRNLRLFLLITALSSILCFIYGAEVDKTDYRAKLTELQKLSDNGISNPDLYYNIGVCQAKLNRESHAMLAYLRCVNLNSAHTDARSNIDYLISLSKDSQLYPQTQFIAGLLLNIYDWFNINRTALALLLSLLLSGLCLHWLLHYHQDKERGLAVLSLILGICLSLSFMALLITKQYRLSHNNKAVITANTADLREAASNSARVIREIHSSLIVRISEERGGQARIVLPNGNSGWVRTDQFERVLIRTKP